MQRPFRWLPLVLATTLASLGWLVPTALAKSSRFDETSARAFVKGTHGYGISVEGFAFEGPLGVVTVTVRGAHGAEAEYSVAGRVTTRRIRANLGRFGRVSVRFVGGPPRHRSRRDECARERDSIRHGSFAGVIRFRGEDGFTSASASRARGSVVYTSGSFCSHSSRPPRPGSAARSASSHESLRTTELEAGRREPHGGTSLFFETSAEVLDGEVETETVALLTASVFEDRGRIEIERRASFELPSASLQVEGHSPESLAATFAPPPPLAGSATYTQAGAKPGRWSGDLRVSLPGAPAVPLAGPGFKSLLCRGSVLSSRFERCIRQANELFNRSLEG